MRKMMSEQMPDWVERIMSDDTPLPPGANPTPIPWRVAVMAPEIAIYQPSQDELSRQSQGERSDAPRSLTRALTAPTAELE